METVSNIWNYMYPHIATFGHQAIDLATPFVVAFVVGFVVTKANNYFKKVEFLKDIEIAEDQRKAIENAAILIVRSINQKSIDAKKQGEKLNNKPDMAFDELKKLFPDVDNSLLDNIIKSSVQTLLPEKIAIKKLEKDK